MVLSSSAMVEMCVILAPAAIISANTACSKDSEITGRHISL
jgi:hypothetical protein